MYKMCLMKADLLHIRNFDTIVVSPQIYQKILESASATLMEPITSKRGYKFLIDRNTKGTSYLMENVS